MLERNVKRSGQFVVPGERLGVIEEFLPGPGTYVRNGAIYSSITGHMLIDALRKTVSIYPRVHLPVVPHEGSVVIGQVSSVQDKFATVQIFKVGKKDLPSGFFSGNIHVSMVSPDYVKSMFDAFKVGDIVRASVVNDKNLMYQLSTANEELGVLYAFCSRCGHSLLLKNHFLHCLVCKNVERRKTAPDYGNAVL